MNKFTSLLAAASATLLLCAPASADSLIQLWSCKISEGGTQDEMMELSTEWLKAVRSMDGGSQLRVLIEYPMAADAAFGDFTFVLIAPDAATWGTFMDGYDHSAAAEVDEAWNEVASCSSSSMWQSIELSVD